MKKIILSLFVACIATLSFAQVGLENVIVEEIDASSVMDGATTYRVFVDLEAGYELQLLKGDENCDLNVSTTGMWYNSIVGGTSSNNIISAIFPSFPEVSFDSYVSLGGATNTDEWAVLYEDDTDGTVDGRMILGGTLTPTVNFVSGTIGASADNNFGSTTTETTFIENMAGSYGTFTSNGDITPNNRIMIGQFTTDGEFSFALNIQINPVGMNDPVYLTACDNPILNFPAPIFGCTDVAACNFDAEATADDDSCLIIGEGCDDGDVTTINDTVSEDCMCIGDPIVMGCTDDMACNYDENANVDNGSCLIIGSLCDDNDATTTNDMITEDCLCEGVPVVMGCTDDAACNYDADANMDDGTCLIVGDACDDGDPLTVNDMITGDCLCEGVEGLEDLAGNNSDLTIYPNPAQNELFLNFDLVETEQIQFEIFDISGKAVISELSTINSGQVAHTLDSSSLEAGMYLLRISNSEDSTTLRFSILR